MLIGITGLNASGKDTAAEYLKTKGFFLFSLSDVIREECRARGQELTRENLISLGGALRAKHGNSYLACEALRTIASRGVTNVVIVSIRHSEEVKELKKNPDFHLIVVESPIETRYQRVLDRGREGGQEQSFEKFKRLENNERASINADQQLDKVIAMADARIDNSGSFEKLNLKLDAFIDEIKKI